MPEPVTSRTLSQVVYADVRSDILAGRYPPGARLSPRVVATKHQVSLSVVREALTRLTEQGLVVAQPQQGFAVVGLNLDDVRDLARVRVLVEGAAMRDAVTNADVEYEAQVVASHHRLSRTHFLVDGTTQTVTEEWARAHQEFHRTLVSACTSPRLRDLAEGMRVTAELYRRWSGSFSSLTDRDGPAEHRSLTEAALDRDADRAARLATYHIERTTALLESYLEHQRGQADAPLEADRG